MPSSILINPTVWPQYTNVTDRTGRTDRTTVREHRVNRFTNGRRKRVCPMLSDHCPVCLSCPVCDVRALWPNGWMDQDDTWHAGRRLGPGHTALDGDPAPPPPKGHSLYLLRPNGWMDQDATWYGSRPRPRRLCWGPHSPSPKKGGAPPNFRPMFIVANGWMDQDGTWHAVGLSPGNFVLDGDIALRQKGPQRPSQF